MRLMLLSEERATLVIARAKSAEEVYDGHGSHIRRATLRRATPHHVSSLSFPSKRHIFRLSCLGALISSCVIFSWPTYSSHPLSWPPGIMPRACTSTAQELQTSRWHAEYAGAQLAAEHSRRLTCKSAWR
jgi:hypothetical protein